MFRAIAKSFSGLAKRPLLFLPAILFVLADYFLLFGQREQFMDAIALGAFGGQGLLQSMASAFYADQVGFLVMVVALAVLFFLEVFVAFAYSRAAYDLDRNVSSFLAFRETIGMFWEAVKFWIFALFVVLLFLASMTFSLWVYGYVEYLGVIFAAITAVAGIGAFIGLSMTIPAMATRQLELKRALKDSWAFAKKHFWGILLLLIILLVVNEIILGIANAWIVGSLIALKFPEYEPVVNGAIQALKLSYSGMAIALFYINRQQKKK